MHSSRIVHSGWIAVLSIALVTASALAQQPEAEPKVDAPPKPDAPPSPAQLATEQPAAAQPAKDQPAAVFSDSGESLLRPAGKLEVRSDLNNQAALQLANPLEELYLVVISEPKPQLPGDITLEKYREAALNNITKATRAMKSGEPKSLQINGHPALQTQFSASVPGIEPRVTYVLTTVESPAAYHQVLGWTLESMADKNVPILVELTGTFLPDLAVLTSEDGTLRITLPPGMTKSDAFEGVALQAVDAATELYAVAIREPKQDLPEDMTLAKYYEAQVAKLKEATRGAKVAEPRRLTIDGHPALQTTITAEFPGIEDEITYLVTDVETPDAFIHLQGWTPAKAFAENEPSLRTIVDSLRLLKGERPAQNPEQSPPE